MWPWRRNRVPPPVPRLNPEALDAPDLLVVGGEHDAVERLLPELAKSGVRVAIAPGELAERIGVSFDTVAWVIGGVRVGSISAARPLDQVLAALESARTRIGTDLQRELIAWRGTAPGLDEAAWSRAIAGGYDRVGSSSTSFRIDAWGTCEVVSGQSGFQGSDSRSKAGHWRKIDDYTIEVQWESYDREVEIGWSTYASEARELATSERFLLGWRGGRVCELRESPPAARIPSLEPSTDRYAR